MFKETIREYPITSKRLCRDSKLVKYRAIESQRKEKKIATVRDMRTICF